MLLLKWKKADLEAKLRNEKELKLFIYYKVENGRVLQVGLMSKIKKCFYLERQTRLKWGRSEFWMIKKF